MKAIVTLLFLTISATALLAASLPFISTPPQTQTVPPNSIVVFTVESTNATSYQWRFNGVDIPWGTYSFLVVSNAQPTNSGYYVAIAKNATGWTPSPMAYLSVVWSNGILPLYNTNVPNAVAQYQYDNYFNSLCPSLTGTPITNGTAQMYVGPELDQMSPAGGPRTFRDGYYGTESMTRLAQNVAPGQSCYYRVDVSYTPPCPGSGSYTQQSTTFKLIAGGHTSPIPTPTGTAFPTYAEWPEIPASFAPSYSLPFILVPGENFNYQIVFGSFLWYTCPRQWRKDGVLLPSATNATCLPNGNPFKLMTLQLTNVQPSDAGVYDFYGEGAVAFGKSTSWIMNKIPFSVWLTNGEGMLHFPRAMSDKFVCDLEGAPSRKYDILTSSNFVDWSKLMTLSNATGTVTFTNSLAGAGSRFYRARLVPIGSP